MYVTSTCLDASEAADSVSFVETWMKGRTIAECDRRRETEFEDTFWFWFAELVNSTGKVSVKFVLTRPLREMGTFRVCELP